MPEVRLDHLAVEARPERGQKDLEDEGAESVPGGGRRKDTAKEPKGGWLGLRESGGVLF